MEKYRRDSWERLKKTTNDHSPEGMVIAAAKKWKDLMNKMDKAIGVPPHSDFWHQSIDEVNYNLKKAIERLDESNKFTEDQ